MVGAALPGTRGARHEPGAADARRQGLRQRLRHPHARRRPVRGSHRDAVCESVQTHRVRAVAGVGLFEVFGAGGGESRLAAGKFVLEERPSPFARCARSSLSPQRGERVPDRAGEGRFGCWLLRVDGVNQADHYWPNTILAKQVFQSSTSRSFV